MVTDDPRPIEGVPVICLGCYNVIHPSPETVEADGVILCPSCEEARDLGPIEVPDDPPVAADDRQLLQP